MTLYASGKTAQVYKEMHIYNLHILGLCETRWNGTGQTRLVSGDTIIYSGQEEDHPNVYGVGFLMSPKAKKKPTLLETSLTKDHKSQILFKA